MGIIDEIKEAVSTKGISSRASEIKEVFTGSGDYREIKPDEIKDSHDKEEVLDEPERKDYDRSLKAKIKSKSREKISNIKKSVVSAYTRPFDTSSEREQRVKDEDIARINKATFGMGKTEKAAYETTHYTQKSARAIEKAKKDVPIGETADEKRDRLKKKRERAEDVRHAYQKSKASAAGTEAGKAGFGSGIFDITRPQKEDGREIRNPVSSGLVPHGFLPPNQGYAPGFGGNRQQLPSAPISQSGELYNPMFVSQAPPVPQPERRMSRNESHRQQVRNDTQRWKQEQIQQYQQQMYNQFAPQAPPQRDGRNEPYQQPQNGARPQFIDMFAGHQPTNNNGKGSEQQSHPRMKNLFQRDDAPTNNKIAGHEPHPLAKFSGELLNISGNGKKKYVKALWEV
jgi:hypothetical protein